MNGNGKRREGVVGDIMTKQRTRKSKLVYSFVKIDYCSVEMPLGSAFPALISVEIDKRKIGRNTMLAFHSFAKLKYIVENIFRVAGKAVS